MDKPEEEQTRPSDYGADVSRTESHAVATHYDPGTQAQLKRAVRILAIALVVGFIAVRLEHWFHDRGLSHAAAVSQEAVTTVDVIEARPVSAAQRFTLPGETAAWYTSTIYARVNGYVGHWFVDIGDHVKKGDVLAVLETPELDADLAAARAQLDRANAEVQVRRSEAQFASTQYERWRDSPKGVVSEQEREQKHSEFDTATAQYRAAAAQVALSKAQLDRYAALAQFKKVTAPFDGVITTRNIDIGNLVTAGSTSATAPLYVMTQNDPMRVFVDVPQSAAAELMQGAPAVTIQTSDGAGRSYAGSVARTSQAINAHARTLRVEVDLANKEGLLVPGLYVRAAFSLPPRGRVQVPAAALLFRSGGPQVARVDGQGRIVFQDVTIARDDGNVVELAAGASVGERLALNLSSQVSAGDRVSIHELRPTGAPGLDAAVAVP